MERGEGQGGEGGRESVGVGLVGKIVLGVVGGGRN